MNNLLSLIRGGVGVEKLEVGGGRLQGISLVRQKLGAVILACVAGLSGCDTPDGLEAKEIPGSEGFENGGSEGESSKGGSGGAGGEGGKNNCVPSFGEDCNLPGECRDLMAKKACNGECELVAGQIMPSTFAKVEVGNLCSDGLDNDCDGSTDFKDNSCK